MTEEAKEKERPQKRRRKRWMALVVLGSLIGFVAVRITRFVIAQPTITTDYTSEYNALTRPTAYDPNDNAAPLYALAFEILSARPDDPEALQIVARAAEKPYWWVEWTGFDETGPEVITQMAGLRQAAQGLRDRALSLTGDGDIDQALQSVTTIGKMARHTGSPGVMPTHGLLSPALSGLAQSTAWALLAEYRVGSDRLEAFQQTIEATLVRRKPLSFVGERIRLRDIVQRYFTDDGRGDGHLIAGRIFDDYRRAEELPNELADAVAYLNHLVIAWRHPSRGETVRLLEELIPWLNELARQTPWQLHQRGTDYETEIRRRIAGYYLLELAQLDSSLGRTLEIHYRACVSSEALVATIALLRYRQDKGRWPETLAELVADGYLHDAPRDPFSGNSLVYRPTGKTFLLYSYGADFDDDGGTPSRWGRDAKGATKCSGRNRKN